MPHDWKPFLEMWSAAMVKPPYIEEYHLSPEIIRSRWLGYPGATEAQIAAAEARLGRRLPPSFRSFLQVTNGWRFTGILIEKLWNTDEVDWFRVRNQDWIDIHSQFPDAEDIDGGFPPVSHLRASLEVSEVFDSTVCLLNPLVVGPDGEWQAIFMASWIPGAYRFPSFWDLMQHEYQSFRDLDTQEQKRFLPGVNIATLPAKIDDLIALLRAEVANVQQVPTGSTMNVQQAYFAGWIEAVEVAINEVKRLSDQNSYPNALKIALLALADDLECDGMAFNRKVQQSAQATLRNLWRSLGQLASIQRDSGAAIGKQKAAGTIRYFFRQ